MSHNIHYATEIQVNGSLIWRSTSIRYSFAQRFAFLRLEWGGFRGEIVFFEDLALHRVHYYVNLGRFVPMAEVSGFCLKCKTYGPIKDGKMIKMSNGRTRCAGFCSQPGCTGKISKIVS